MRRADAGDLAAVAELLAPLEAAGVLAPRPRAQLEADLPFFVVAEREAKARERARRGPKGASPTCGACRVWEALGAPMQVSGTPTRRVRGGARI